MKIAAVVCEYNPFHFGHLCQIREIRRALGEDTAVVAVMSGNFVQRGEPAILGKFDRAQMALAAGCSLVLELPFPHSMAAAPYFTDAGVFIANALSIVDYLSFGSETGDISRLAAVADNLSSPIFEQALKQNLDRKDLADIGYAAIRSLTYRELYGEETALSSPNDILAVGYLSALKRQGSAILPHPVKRTGTDEDAADAERCAGATYIRSLLRAEDETALSHLPCPAPWLAAKAQGYAPTSLSHLSSAILADLRMREPTADEYADSEGGLYHRILRHARRVSTLEELLKSVATKKYTAARLRRALLFAYFRVSADMLRHPPAYTQVLATNGVGREILSSVRKKASIPIITKPADLKKLSPEARTAVERAYRADSIYALSSPSPLRGDAFLTIPPKID